LNRPQDAEAQNLCMTLKQIEAFYWAANLGSFSIAALRLHVTQSSLSKRIFELEESVGAVLFDRSSKRAQLTEAGQRLVPLAGRMLELREQFQGQVRASAALSGTCKFGVSELASLTWLPDFTRLVNQEHPALVLEPYIDLARPLERKVQRGELDFAVAPGPGQQAQVKGSVIGRVDFTWAAAPGRLRKGALLRKTDLESLPIITMTEGSGLTRAIESWAAEQGITLRRNMACNSLMAIVALVLSDTGISFLPDAFLRPWVAQGALVALKSSPPLPSLNYYFFQRADDNRTLLEAMHGYVIRTAEFSRTPEHLEPHVKSQKRNDRPLK
jgi:DNA-binding transcriptional LysR family regulator